MHVNQFKDVSTCTGFTLVCHHPGARVKLKITFMIYIQEYRRSVLQDEENKLSYMTIHSLLRKLAILAVLPPAAIFKGLG